MPELPEVEATRDNLARWTRAAGPITDVQVLDPRLALDRRALVGRRVLAARRHGKQLALDLARPRARTPDLVLAAHLGMTGKWVRAAIDAPPRPHARLVLAFGDVASSFVDPRRFGDVRVLAPGEDPFAGLGPDALDAPLSTPALRAALGRGRAPLKARLLDQRRLAGLGNIAAVEACHRARVHPHTPVDDVPERAWRDLPRAIHDHLVKTLDDCLGHDEIAYLSEGAPSPFLVYGHEGAPCPRCRATGRLALVVKTSHAGRPTYYCARCQPLPLAPEAR
ncbi:MAG: Fpg/Nei family DNA glycosylase [Deltaproteobacteria bacterium]|nr:Fpg/Nei family DNA glycosylase [Deltaproteobacteria bacterium]